MTTPPRLADRIAVLAGSVDLSGFAPFFAPLMFFLNENLWLTMTLMVSLAAVLLATLVIVGRPRGTISPVGIARSPHPTKLRGFTRFGCGRSVAS
jgi:hypothetical protein